MAGLFSFCAMPARALDDLIITELMAENDNTLADEDGDFPDWIEIYNAGTNSVNLEGWRLTDSPDNPGSWWRFPATNLPINQYIVVFASGKDRRIPGRPLHTDFKLNNSGDYLALAKPDGVTLASVYPGYPLQVAGISYGIPMTLTASTIVSNGTPGKFTVPLNGNLGDSWTAIGFNDAGWLNVVNGVGFEADAGPSGAPVVLADSVAEFSGTQGQNNWYYGYWDKTVDASGLYEAADFTPFPRGTGNTLSSTNYWDGSKWHWPGANAPLTEISTNSVHPSGNFVNPALPVHWSIRRYVSEAAGPLRISGILAASSTNGTCGDGVIAHVIIDGVEVWQRPAFYTSEGYSIVVNANVGSTIDFAVDPGPANNELCDATIFTAIVRTAAGNVVLADSIRDWSIVGQQGARNWTYGYSDRTADVGGIYGPGDFVPFPSGLGSPHSSANFWDGQAWHWFDGDPPFDLIGQLDVMPSVLETGGVKGNQHWVIRRWVSEVAGTLQIDWHVGKKTLGGGGVVATIYQNGTQRDSILLGGNDFAGILKTLTLPGVNVGDILDFTIAPGSDVDNDLSFFNATIHGYTSLSNQFVTDVGGVMTNLNSTAYLRIPFNLADVATINGLTLRLKYDDGFAAYLNGVLVASANSPLSNVWNSVATQARSDADGNQYEDYNLDNLRDILTPGANVLAIQGMNISATDPDFLLSAQLLVSRASLDPSVQRYFPAPTPGSLNGLGTTTLGPLITKVQHVPAEPNDTEDLVVTAKVTPTLNPLSSIRLNYRVMYGSEASVAMVDDGLHGDGAPGDGIYGASIPNAISNPGEMIRYYITASDNLSHLSRLPALGDTNNLSLYFGTVVQDPSLTNKLPVLHWFIPAAAGSPLDNGTASARCSLYWHGEFYDNVRFGRHGQSSSGFKKKSYNIDFNPDHHFDWAEGEKRVDDINLLTTYPDKAHMRNMLSYQVHHDSGPHAPYHFAFPVRLQSNAVFYGTAHIVENGDDNFLKRIGRDPNGAFYKIYNTDGSPSSTPAQQSTVDGAEKKTRRFEPKDDLNAVLVALGPPGTGDSVARRMYMYDNLDVSEIVSYLAATIVTGNVDCCHKNYYLYRDTEGDGEWEMYPWDVDLSFGRNWSSSQSYFDDGVYPQNGLFVGGNARVPSAIFNTPATRQMYFRRLRTLMDRLQQPTNTPVSELNFEKQIDAWAAQLAPDAAMDLVKWGSWGGGAQNIFDVNSPYYRTLPQSVAETKTNYMPARRRYVYDQHMGASAADWPNAQPANVTIQIGAIDFSPASGKQSEEYIQLLNPNTFAVDMSGWTLTGAVTHTFQGGVVMPSNSALYVVADRKAFRARSTAPKGGQGLYIEGPYSGQLSARGETIILADDTGRIVNTNLYVGNPSGPQQYLRITEIMYHPQRPPAGSPFDAEEFEYLEFRNTGPVPIELGGVHISNGVEFTFPSGPLAPGAYVLVVRNLAAFTSRYGGGLNVAGQWTGILDNSGENIRVDDAVGEKILDFSYNNSWYAFTDGPGASLVIRNDTADWRSWDLKDSWRPSAFDLGSPGLTDGAPISSPTVLVNEVLTHSDPPAVDVIELYNPNAASVDISGWFLTDDFASPKKYTIPAGTSIPAHGYLVFYETNSFGTGPNAFALSSKGDETYLFAGNGANLIGFFDGFSYDGADAGVSFGRYINSQTNTHFVAQAATSFGATNGQPAVGPVVISEINYRPVEPSPGVDNSIDEYVELANITGSPVPMFDPAHPVNTWRLRSAVDFNFPPNITLNAGQHCLLVSFNPADQNLLSTFRARYSVPPATLVLGPFSGQLGNNGESVRLYKPGTPDTNSLPVVPFILVDRIDYSNQLPWPAAADGIGPSLQRLVESAYGNDPLNWVAVGPSAGRSFVPGGTPPSITAQPSDVVGVVGRTSQFSVGVGGSPPFFYQWRFNGVNIYGANNQVLTLNGVQLNQAGDYSVVVFNSAGSIESNPAHLSVLIPVSIAAHPQPVKLRGSTNVVDYGFTTNSATFSVVANIQRPTRYQWRFNGVPIAGETGTTLTVPSVGLNQDGNYDVVASDDVSTVTSNPARLTVLISPVFLTVPTTQFVPSNSTFTVAASFRGNPTPFRVEWREVSSVRATTTNSDTTIVFTSGAITNKFPGTVTTWRLVIFNEATSAAGSVASFSVYSVPDTDGDGIPDDWETLYGLNPGSNSDRNLDADGDGLSNYAEYLTGGDPTNSASALRLQQTIHPGSSTALSFGATSNRTYSVRYTDSLTPGSWRKLADVFARTTNRVETVTDPAWTSNRFYQVVTPLQP
jgi:hypothetical protein